MQCVLILKVYNCRLFALVACMYVLQTLSLCDTFKNCPQILVSQIDCESNWKAPNGCLQYHTGVSGVFESWNYGNQQLQVCKLRTRLSF